MSKQVQQTSPFEIGDPWEHWLSQARALAAELQLPCEFIDEACAIVENAFGHDWLSALFGKQNLSHKLVPKPLHRLDTLFGVAGKSQVVELIELAVYLKQLATCSGIPSVMDVIREHYATGFLQLAYAYRFHRAGATAIALEPETDRGKSDIFFEYDSRPYIAECYVPQFASEANSIDNLRTCVQLVGHACRVSDYRLRVCIRLKDSISVRESKQLGRWLSHRIDEMDGDFWRGEHDVAHCEVKHIDETDDVHDRPRRLSAKEREGFADAVIEMYRVPKSDIAEIRLGREARREPGSRVLLWRPDEECQKMTSEEYVEKLAARLGDKLPQTKRSVDNPGRLVIAELKDFVENDEESLVISGQLQKLMLRSYPDVSAIFLVQRSWIRGSRYQFQGVLIGGKPENAPPEKLFQQLDQQEREMDVLAAWS
ncbi:MAG: hypothetical protein H6822_15410 [Planctomycetaceae bacterium]|nr:hypothetical protein [Planctomycetales bacterium]MCB9923569.1 hypothetical protein [Planctomycetaceae bacterium]